MARFVKIKTVVVGEAGAGKTNLIEHLTRRRFDPARLATRHFERASMWMEMGTSGDVAIVDLWDTAGQESSRHLVPTFYQGSHICLIVYDVCNRHSFSSVSWWLHAYLDHRPPGVTKFSRPNVALIGTQSDIRHLREVTSYEGTAMAQSLGIPYFGENSSVEQQKCSDVDHIIAQMTQATFRTLDAEQKFATAEAERKAKEARDSFVELQLDDELPIVPTPKAERLATVALHAGVEDDIIDALLGETKPLPRRKEGCGCTLC